MTTTTLARHLSTDDIGKRVTIKTADGARITDDLVGLVVESPRWEDGPHLTIYLRHVRPARNLDERVETSGGFPVALDSAVTVETTTPEPAVYLGGTNDD